MKKIIVLILSLMVGLIFISCNENLKSVDETRIFVDSVGREVTIPKEITKIAVTGPLAQIVVFSIAPNEMVGIAVPWTPASEMILNEDYYNLPILGQLYGGKGEMNLETLLESGAQLVIDIGEPKDTIVSDLNDLQEQTNIPFVHITTTMSNMGEAYIKLGELLNKKEEGKELSDYCNRVYNKAMEISNSVEKANVLYCLGDKGQNVIAKDSYHGEIIDLMTNNLAIVDQPVSKGTGNEVDMEQIIKWNPDVIFFAPDSIYTTVEKDPAWQTLKAIQNNQYYEVPEGPYNWMGFPPSVQRYLGLHWMISILYPEEMDKTLFDEVQLYFDLFYHSTLTEELFQQIVNVK
ncbi:MAG: ABC transporter substrate-binding protein [Clostridia bacterium]|nr:ABC transporter substrate-binding protein [Clostridia bacterium]